MDGGQRDRVAPLQQRPRGQRTAAPTLWVAGVLWSLLGAAACLPLGLAGSHAGHRHEGDGLALGVEELGGEAQVVMERQKSDPLQPDHDDLHHPHQGFGILLKDSLESQSWKPEHGGRDGSAG